MTSKYQFEEQYYVLAITLADQQLIKPKYHEEILTWFKTNLADQFKTRIRLDIDNVNNILFCSFNAHDAELLTTIYEFLHTLYYTNDFLTLWEESVGRQVSAPIFYCGCGIGELHNLRTPNSTLSGLAVEYAKRAIQHLINSRGTVQAYKFARLPFQLGFVATADSLANELAALFYLTYEVNLTTLIKQVVYFTSLPDRANLLSANAIRHQYQVGQLLGQKFHVKSYQLDYADSIEHSKVSARLSKILRELNRPQITRTKEIIRHVIKKNINKHVE